MVILLVIMVLMVVLAVVLVLQKVGVLLLQALELLVKDIVVVMQLLDEVELVHIQAQLAVEGLGLLVLTVLVKVVMQAQAVLVYRPQ